MNSLRYAFAAILLGFAAACTADPTTPPPPARPVHSSGIIGSGFRTESTDSLSKPPTDSTWTSGR